MHASESSFVVWRLTVHFVGLKSLFREGQMRLPYRKNIVIRTMNFTKGKVASAPEIRTNTPEFLKIEFSQSPIKWTWAWFPMNTRISFRFHLNILFKISWKSTKFPLAPKKSSDADQTPLSCREPTILRGNHSITSERSKASASKANSCLKWHVLRPRMLSTCAFAHK